MLREGNFVTLLLTNGMPFVSYKQNVTVNIHGWDTCRRENTVSYSDTTRVRVRGKIINVSSTYWITKFGQALTRLEAWRPKYGLFSIATGGVGDPAGECPRGGEACSPHDIDETSISIWHLLQSTANGSPD